MSKTKYTEKDAAKETDSGGRETARAWHQAREDAREIGEIPTNSDGDKEDDKKE